MVGGMQLFIPEGAPLVKGAGRVFSAGSVAPRRGEVWPGGRVEGAPLVVGTSRGRAVKAGRNNGVASSSGLAGSAFFPFVV